MKKIVIALATVAALSSVAAHAENTAFVFVGAGVTQVSGEDQNYDKPINVSGGQGLTTVMSHDKSAGTFQIGGGQRFDRIGYELSYINVGDLKSKHTWNGVDINVKKQSNIFTSAVTYTLPIVDNFSVTGKLGVSTGQFKYKANVPSLGSSGDVTNTHSGVLAGVTAEYDVTKSVAVRADYTYLDKFGDQHGNLFTLGVGFKF